ncbi:hypothetical protein [Aliarcobacter butzleri]|uniref:hypothetical protein n=1 Tax=Aliarcobacter butzleri TaxID=28197 RepID=UPI003B223A92
MKKIVITIMLMLGFGLNAYAYENTSRGVVEAFFKAIADNDGQKAITYLDNSGKNFKTLSRPDTRKIKVDLLLNGLFGDWQVKDKQIQDTSKYEFQIEPYNDMFIVHTRNKTSSIPELQEFQSGLSGVYTTIKTQNINGKWLITYIQ